jgi:putative oxidoreductase
MKKGSNIKSRILNTENDNKIIIIRLIVGLVFISEGIQKFLFLVIFGPGFFREIGFGHAFFWAYFTGTCEILFGILIIIGLLTRLASIPLLVVMIIAFITTKLPLLLTKGFWAFLHEYNVDFCLTMLLILLLIYGGGKWSVDLKILKLINPLNFFITSKQSPS